MQKKAPKIILASVILGMIAAFFLFDLQSYLSLEVLKARQDEFRHFFEENKALTLFVYFVIYVLSTALSLPGATVLTLAAGALFGFGTGLVIVSFASTLGATLAFLSARYLLRESIQGKFGDRLGTINKGIESEGAFYLLGLRLVPLFPFFVINLVMGLTPIRTWTFFWVSQVGMLPGTAVYVNAGTQLARIDSLKGILSPGLLLSFALLGLFPLLAKQGLKQLQKRRGTKHDAK